jgi:hypothetical protein
MVVGASLVCICDLTTPFCSHSSATASTNKVTPIPDNLSIAASRATIDEAALADLGDEDDDKNAGEYNYFGNMPNPDPEDDSPRDLCGDFVPLFAKSRKIAKDYSKDRKVRIFYDALTVDQSTILGDSPPRAMKDIFKLWLGQVRNRAKWTLDRIAEAVFIISKHACDHQEMIVKRGGPKPLTRRSLLSCSCTITFSTRYLLPMPPAFRRIRRRPRDSRTSRRGRRRSLYRPTFAMKRIRYV